MVFFFFFFFAHVQSNKKYFLSRSIWSIDGTLTGIAIPGQSGHGSDSHEKLLHTTQTSKTGILASDTV